MSAEKNYPDYSTVIPTFRPSARSIWLKKRGLSPISRAQNRRGRAFASGRHSLAESLGMTISSILLTLLVLLSLMSCSDNNDAYSEMPPKVTSFVAKYFPNYNVDSYSTSADAIHVRLKDGPGITFDKDQLVESVNGYGSTLPQMLLFDTLPPKLYSYLESGQNLDDVFAIYFSPKTVYVILLNYSLIYDNATGEIQQEITPPA